MTHGHAVLFSTLSPELCQCMSESKARHIDPFEILAEYYPVQSKTHDILIRHGELVAAKALRIAERAGIAAPDADFIWEAAMLHDIGIFMTHAPSIGCHGPHAYICHGYLGRELLEKKGLFRHALVCETHVGAGITAREIKERSLPLPLRDMVPVSVEEQIICYADKFYSKDRLFRDREKSVNAILQDLEKYGRDKVLRFRSWVDRFEQVPPELPGNGSLPDLGVTAE